MNRLRQDRRLQNCFFFFFSSMSLRNTYLFLHVYLLMQYLIKKDDKFGCKSIHIWENMPPAHFYNNISYYKSILWKEGCFSLYEIIPYLRMINRNTCILRASFCFSLIIVSFYNGFCVVTLTSCIYTLINRLYCKSTL